MTCGNLSRFLKPSIIKIIYGFRFKRSFCDLELTEELKKAIEIKWSKDVTEGNYDESNKETLKSYVLAMFPYPSGNLHMGHVRVYTISDTISRFQKLLGKNVFHPIGFDAFGLPAENAALERNIPAQDWTEVNIDYMRQQLKQLGCSFDWDYEIVTSSVDYYKFTQYLFLLLFKAGLVYQKEAVVNWDPIDKTVLAEEQVDNTGHSWRSGALVEKKLLGQWFIRTTWFANSLRRGLDYLSKADWKDIIKLQKHWIGECNGANFDFKIVKMENILSSLTVWTEFPEFISESAFLAIDSKNVLALKECDPPAEEKKLDIEAVNPFTNKKIPVYVTNQIDFDEGCTVKLGLPNVYEKDRVFAENHNISFLSKNSIVGNYEERWKICRLANIAGIGGYPTSSKLCDWLISRQRKWGTPIPIIHCSKCGPVAARFEDLPVIISNSTKDQEANCPQCNSVGTWEKDTMDTFVDSSWYFIRYLDPKNDNELCNKLKLFKMMPVDIYIGGKEHAVLHLYYARFISYFLHSIGILKEPEPFKRLLVQGMVMGKTYCFKETGKYVPKSMVFKTENGFKDIQTHQHVVEAWEKMSKSKCNGVEPNEILRKYGIDTTRLIILSDVAPTSNKLWNEDDFVGILKWQKRIWSLINQFKNSKDSAFSIKNGTRGIENEKEMRDHRNYFVKNVTFTYKVSHQLSVGISKLQEFTNSLKKVNIEIMNQSLEFERSLACFIIMLFPMAPHFSSELWFILRKHSSELMKRRDIIDLSIPVHHQLWPKLDADYDLDVIFNVNNATKSHTKIPYDIFCALNNKKAFDLALKNDKIKKFITGCDILETSLTVIEDFEGIFNIVIDHNQKKQKLHESKLSL